MISALVIQLSRLSLSSGSSNCAVFLGTVFDSLFVSTQVYINKDQQMYAGRWISVAFRGE